MALNVTAAAHEFHGNVAGRRSKVYLADEEVLYSSYVKEFFGDVERFTFGPDATSITPASLGRERNGHVRRRDRDSLRMHIGAAALKRHLNPTRRARRRLHRFRRGRVALVGSLKFPAQDECLRGQNDGLEALHGSLDLSVNSDTDFTERMSILKKNIFDIVIV